MAKQKKTTSAELLFHKLQSKVIEQLNQNEIERNVLQQKLQVINEIFISFNDTGKVKSIEKSDIDTDVPKSKKAVKKKAVKKNEVKKREYKKRSVKKVADQITEIEPSNGNGHAGGANGKPLSWFGMAGKVMSRQKFMTSKEITDEIQKQFDLGERKIGSSVSATLSGNIKSGKVVSKQFDDGLKYKLK